MRIVQPVMLCCSHDQVSNNANEKYNSFHLTREFMSAMEAHIVSTDGGFETLLSAIRCTQGQLASQIAYVHAELIRKHYEFMVTTSLP